MMLLLLSSLSELESQLLVLSSGGGSSLQSVSSLSLSSPAKLLSFTPASKASSLSLSSRVNLPFLQVMNWSLSGFLHTCWLRFQHA